MCVISLLPLTKVSKGEYFGGAEINFMFYAKHKGGIKVDLERVLYFLEGTKTSIKIFK